MKINRTAYQWSSLVAIVSMLAFALTGCSGSDGSDGAPGPAGPPGTGVVSVSTATSLTIDINSVTINSPPVVNFTVKNQDGIGVTGFAASDLRFNIAKLMPGTNGGPSTWQNYVNRLSSGALQGSQERASTGGTLVDHKDGTFTYTFVTDITSAAATCPSYPSPCKDADGNTLDLSYQPSLVHRVTIQQGNSAYPLYNATYTFMPGGGQVASGREIVQTATCNQCHNKISAHGTRIETKLCVTCHNPGSWVKGTPNTPVDFKVMIHKIHRGEDLPSVKAGVPYIVNGTDFSTVVFPFSSVALGDTRACTKCHDGSAAQSDNWKNVPSKPACGACHDDVYFGAAADPLKPYQTVSHATLSGIADPADGTCTLCHGVGKPEDVVVKHDLPNLLTAEGAKYQFNVVSAANTGPQAPGGAAIQVVFSVKNPSTGTAYNIKTDPAFACVPGTGLPASVSMLVGWNNSDENNTGSGSNPGQPYSASVLDSYSSGTGLCSDNANVTGPDGSGNFTLTLTGKVIPLGTTGSGRAALYGRTTKDVDGDGTKENVRIKAAYKDFAITDPTPVARRTVVDIAKCDKCHDSLSLHGDARTDEPGLCVLCHNPSATDVSRRPKIAAGVDAGFPDASITLDGKREEAIDFKRLIHGIHAAAATDYTGAPAEGFRKKGLVVWGYPGAGNSTCVAPAYTCQNDFSDVRFPGILNDCYTCHTTKTIGRTTYGTFELVGTWEVPTVSGVLGSSILTAPILPSDGGGTFASQLANQADDLNITPTAAVCSSCHDSDTAKSHMKLNGALFDALQSDINTGVVLEACAICHGPGRLADLKLVHGIQ